MKVNPTKTVSELVTVLPYIIDIDEKKKIYHSWRVAVFSALIAAKTVPQQQVKYIFYAGLLHDIGGVGFPIHIIHYLKRTDKMSRSILLSHPIIGAQLIYNIPKMNPIAKLILDHHEWINGMGYPRAKIEKDIPWGSQIIRIADSIDIYLQLGHIKRIRNMEDKMSSFAGKEYSRPLLKRAIGILKKKRLFYKIYPPKNVPAIFEEVRKNVGDLHIPLKIDAVGRTLEAVAQIIDMKHPFTSGHSLRVSRYAMAIALSMGLPHDDVTKIRWAGLIHDIGKLNVSRRLLDKPTNLTPAEYAEIQKHARQTYNIMSMIPTLGDITLIASAHHEKYDGSGYPFKLKGNEIPLGARILAICDSFDAMTSNRPYRIPRTFEEAWREIKSLSGKQYDPEIVEIALPLLRNLGF
ncbi:MAG: HD domain-containing protein [Candidatus Omnitrophica bacterium]|nr:HD domain-containing protein [Candidatus Omnitrophota bacterium]